MGAPLAWVWALSIPLTWFYVAADSGQPPFADQASPLLVHYGVFKGRSLELSEAWRLIASQWLHVKFPHMMFNAIVVGVVANALEKQFSSFHVLAVGVIGGAIGQLASAIAYPDAFMSGASQAALALGGFALLLFPPRTGIWWFAAATALIAFGLDVFISERGAIKAGHVASFIAGLVAALIPTLRKLSLSGHTTSH